MSYRLLISTEAEELLDGCIQYLLFRLKNRQAAEHLLSEIEKIYERLEENPLQFPLSRDPRLNRMGYREAICPEMDYVIVYRLEEESVYIVGIFHRLENYQTKLP